LTELFENKIVFYLRPTTRKCLHFSNFTYAWSLPIMW